MKRERIFIVKKEPGKGAVKEERTDAGMPDADEIADFTGGIFSTVWPWSAQPDACGYINDVSLLNGMPPNAAWENLAGAYAGPMMITGPADGEGNDAGLSEAQADAFVRELDRRALDEQDFRRIGFSFPDIAAWMLDGKEGRRLAKALISAALAARPGCPEKLG